MRGQWEAKSTDIRYCETCLVTLERRRNAAGRLEGFRDFMRRRFCSLSCANSRNKGQESRNAYLVSCEEVNQAVLRGVRDDDRQAGASRQCGLEEQPAGERADPMSFLSSLLARHALEAWDSAYAAYAEIGFPLALALEAESSGLEPTVTRSTRKQPKP